MMIAVPAPLSEPQLEQAMIAQLHASRPRWLVAHTSPLTITATLPASTGLLAVYLDRLSGFGVAHWEKCASSVARMVRTFTRDGIGSSVRKRPTLRMIVRKAAHFVQVQNMFADDPAKLP